MTIDKERFYFDIDKTQQNIALTFMLSLDDGYYRGEKELTLAIDLIKISVTISFTFNLNKKEREVR